jgi:hypothetical protein
MMSKGQWITTCTVLSDPQGAINIWFALAEAFQWLEKAILSFVWMVSNWVYAAEYKPA